MGKLYHGSATPLEIGTRLRAPIGGYVSVADADLEALMERARPDECVQRSAAVFMVDDPSLVDAAGGNVDYLYLVTPLPGEAVGRHDLAWYSQAHLCMADGDIMGAERCAALYWSGTAFDESGASLFEYLATEAVVQADMDAAPGLGR